MPPLLLPSVYFFAQCKFGACYKGTTPKSSLSLGVCESKPNSGRERESAEEVYTQETNRQMERLRHGDSEALSEMTNTKVSAVVGRSR